MIFFRCAPFNMVHFMTIFKYLTWWPIRTSIRKFQYTLFERLCKSKWTFLNRIQFWRNQLALVLGEHTHYKIHEMAAGLGQDSLPGSCVSREPIPHQLLQYYHGSNPMTSLNLIDSLSSNPLRLARAPGQRSQEVVVLHNQLSRLQVKKVPNQCTMHHHLVCHHLTKYQVKQTPASPTCTRTFFY